MLKCSQLCLTAAEPSTNHPNKALLARQAYTSSSPLNPSSFSVRGWGEACRSLRGLWGLASLGAASTLQPCG